MRCEDCDQPATLHISVAQQYACYSEHHYCEPHAQEYLSRQPQASLSGTGARTEGEVQIDVEKVIISEVHDQQVLFFRQVGGVRSFSLVCGVFEATSIDRRLKGLASPRPLTHDAFAATITAMGGRLRDVVIPEVKDHTYFAKLRIHQATGPISGAGRLVEVDVRPSDAVSLAVTCAVLSSFQNSSWLKFAIRIDAGQVTDRLGPAPGV
jgi:bifunctional DNase/RNase